MQLENKKDCKSEDNSTLIFGLLAILSLGYLGSTEIRNAQFQKKVSAARLQNFNTKDANIERLLHLSKEELKTELIHLGKNPELDAPFNPPQILRTQGNVEQITDGHFGWNGFSSCGCTNKTLELTIEQIDLVVNHIKATNPNKDSKIKLLDLGSGEFLPSLILLGKLIELGYTNIHFTFIDFRMDPILQKAITTILEKLSSESEKYEAQFAPSLSELPLDKSSFDAFFAMDFDGINTLSNWEPILQARDLIKDEGIILLGTAPIKASSNYDQKTSLENVRKSTILIPSHKYTGITLPFLSDTDDVPTDPSTDQNDPLKKQFFPRSPISGMHSWIMNSNIAPIPSQTLALPHFWAALVSHLRKNTINTLDLPISYLSSKEMYLITQKFAPIFLPDYHITFNKLKKCPPQLSATMTLEKKQN